LKNGIRFGPVTKGLENLPNGVKGTSYIDCPCHHASDRQYRSHAFYRAQRHQWEVGLSSPNRILDKNRKDCGAATSFWHQRPHPRRDQLLFIERFDLVVISSAIPATGFDLDASVRVRALRQELLRANGLVAQRHSYPEM
jgi:hypothetical protein